MYFCFLFHKNSGSFSFLFRQTLQHPCPLPWKCRVLTTGLPGKSLVPFQYHFTAFILSANKLEWTCLLFTFYCICFDIYLSTLYPSVNPPYWYYYYYYYLGSIPGLGISPREGNSYPLQYSGLESSMDCTVHGVTKSLTQLSDFHFHFYYAP